MSRESENKKKYYAIRTRVIYEKTVLVPVESVEGVEDAIDIVDENVEMDNIDLFSEQPVYDTENKGIYELAKDVADVYQILNDVCLKARDGKEEYDKQENTSNARVDEKVEINNKEVNETIKKMK